MELKDEIILKIQAGKRCLTERNAISLLAIYDDICSCHVCCCQPFGGEKLLEGGFKADNRRASGVFSD